MASVKSASGILFEACCDVLVVGAGAAGLVAALRARDAGADVLVLERDPLPRGSTALSAGLVPAAETRFQAAEGISDSKALFVADIMTKAHGEPDAAAVARVVDVAGEALEWLADQHGLSFTVITNFTYPGHSANRMHGLASRSGAALMDQLRAATEASGIAFVTEALVEILYREDGGRIAGVGITRPDGTTDQIGCRALVLATNGYGGNRALVSAEIPEIGGALYFGHPGNQGDAVIWGRALGAAIRHLSGYQGHGSVAHPHGILITWATITEGGFQINQRGERFANEGRGYSEAAAAVLAQPDGLAWTIFDSRIATIAGQFEDFRQAMAAGAILTADSVEQLADVTKVPCRALQDEFMAIAASSCSGRPDRYGRVFRDGQTLVPPYHAVRVTGALFHTQGGLVVDDDARVRLANGLSCPNLFAAGGAACGVSGAQSSGYLSGNGLLTAVSYGFIAGAAASRTAAGP